MTEWGRETPWRQGLFLDELAIKELELELFGSDTVVIMASHDCDIPQSPGMEPTFEVIIGKFVNQADGAFTNTKSPRKLHVPLESLEGPKTAEFIAINKRYIPKEKLTAIQPKGGMYLQVEDLNIFQRWLGIRYTRSAFPDDFDVRMKSKDFHKKIAKCLTKHGSHILAVFFDVDEGVEFKRLEKEDIYLLDITLLYSTAIDPVASQSSAEQACEELKELFKTRFFNLETKSWEYIELRYCDATSDEAFSYRQSITFKQWRLEHISFADQSGQNGFEMH